MGLQIQQDPHIVLHRLRLHSAAVDGQQHVAGLLRLFGLEVGVRQNGPRPVLTGLHCHNKGTKDQYSKVKPSGAVIFQCFQICRAAGYRMDIVLFLRKTNKAHIGNVNIDIGGIRKVPDSPVRPLLQLRQVIPGGAEHSIAEDRRSIIFSTLRIFFQCRHGPPDIVLIAGTTLRTLNTLQQGLQALRILFQLRFQQSHIPLTLLFVPILREIHIAVMMQEGMFQRTDRAGEIPQLMDRPRKPRPGG